MVSDCMLVKHVSSHSLHKYIFALVIIFLEQVLRNGSTRSKVMNITDVLSPSYFQVPSERVHPLVLLPSDDKRSNLKSFSPDLNAIILK